MRRDCLVTIETPTEGQAPDGQPLTTFDTFATEWANIKHLSGLEALKASAPSSVVKASINIRYREDITSAMRVVYGSRIYKIEAVVPDLETKDGVFLTCEVVSG